MWKKGLINVLYCLCVYMVHAQQQAVSSVQDYVLFPGNDLTLPPGGSVTLSVWQIVNDIPRNSVLKVEQWTIDGKDISAQNPEEGSLTLSLTLDKATYKAPLKVPPHNPVVITVSFQPEGQQTKMILYSRIHVIDKENYFYISNGSLGTGGELYELKEPSIEYARDQLEFAFTKPDSRGGIIVVNASGLRKEKEDQDISSAMSISVAFPANSKGGEWFISSSDDPGIPPYNVVALNYQPKANQPTIAYMSVEQVPHIIPPHFVGKIRYFSLKGSTTITVYDPQHHLLKGYFSGQVVNAEGSYFWASGAFSVRLRP